MNVEKLHNILISLKHYQARQRIKNLLVWDGKICEMCEEDLPDHKRNCTYERLQKNGSAFTLMHSM